MERPWWHSRKWGHSMGWHLSKGSREGSRHKDMYPLFFFFLKILFIYSTETETASEIGNTAGERVRKRQFHGRGAWRGARSHNAGIMPWAEGRCLTAVPPRRPRTCTLWLGYKPLKIRECVLFISYPSEYQLLCSAPTSFSGNARGTATWKCSW